MYADISDLAKRLLMALIVFINVWYTMYFLSKLLTAVRKSINRVTLLSHYMWLKSFNVLACVLFIPMSVQCAR